MVRRGRAVITWGDTKQRFDLKATTKSFGATALGWERKPGAAHYDVLRPFPGPICGAVIDRAGAGRPAAAERRIARIEWEPPETIVRRAGGSDNWPMTWADDGDLYTAYGDG